jgi:hypothetical protein
MDRPFSCSRMPGLSAFSKSARPRASLLGPSWWQGFGFRCSAVIDWFSRMVSARWCAAPSSPMALPRRLRLIDIFQV